ncbi:tRNA (adenosine(37)-N6)-dimethylallyltransferase MiaA [Curtobacterium sp. MCBD17_028]|uniref:tRNA (adenosine(37)-N6)-dimethylallyltransferase MiaA n=1 Tax=Curtobacterium sp. MCBD17_028 TaxID=2175670 RepID=UPI000DA70B27|nr:tRNA (adenosine(37)-N6)-dimethylallyltransferase MiaA [Curtobacterium sp. MCBD17_028]PZE25042.1 tRNA (adenosine(37)-N6)-dimethylallyltransferase MiaA [Curtobacterium sp. MCBD17_028]
MVRPDVIAIVGATGTGKSDLALGIAEALRRDGLPAEIVNADAMQLYRGMDIGTAKVPIAARRGVPHRLLDVLDVTDEASVAAYQRDARAAIDAVVGAGAPVVLVGGSGLYVSSVLHDLSFPATDPELRAALEREADERGADALLERLRALDPAAAAAVDPRNTRRLVRAVEVATNRDPVRPRLPSAPRPWRPMRVLHLQRRREVLVPMLHERAARMFDDGLVDEVAGLVDVGLEAGRTARAAIGYAQALDVLHGRSDLEGAVTSTAVATRQYARRQVSWFRRLREAESLDVTGAGHDDLERVAVAVAADRGRGDASEALARIGA